MTFFRLSPPDYETDQEADARNPVVIEGSHTLPSMDCESCGTWSSSARLRVPVPRDAEEFVGTRFLGPVEWNSHRLRWSALLSVPAEALEPGAALGPPQGRCNARIAEDVVHPFPGLLWVSGLVADRVAGAGFSGVTLNPVTLRGACGGPLWELTIRGRAWRRGSTHENIRVCDACGRTRFEAPRNLSVDDARWDGADFMNLDRNPNIVVVTERVATFIAANRFGNVVATAID